MSYTKGPWKIVRSGGGWVREIEADHGVAVCYGSIDDGNAKLIAAAPDMCEALKEMVSKYAGQVQNDGVYDAALDKARAALAKAGV